MKTLARAAGLMLLLTASSFAASPNLVVNPGFEDPITFDGPPFVGFWEGFNGGPGSSAANSILFPRTGAQSLSLSIIATANTFAGVFQDIPGLSAGSLYSFQGWHEEVNPFDVVTEVRIEWRNSVSNTEITRTLNLNPVPGAAYSLFDLTATVPVGADTARLVYAIQSFGGGPLHTGTSYVDDISFTLVPEPSAMALVAMGGLAVIGLRRRQS
jgi:hypothetical protein